MSEKEFQDAVVEFARWTGWLVFHDNDSRRNVAGFPDLVLVHPVRGVLFCELKTDTGRVTAAQQRWLDTLTAAGAEAYVWRPDDWPLIRLRMQNKTLTSHV